MPGLLKTAAVAAALLLTATTSTATDCFDYGHSPTIVGQMNWPTELGRFVFHGDVAYVVNGTNLLVLDASDALQPSVERTLSLPAGGSSLQVDTDHLYVGTQGAGVQVYTLIDPSDPQPAGSTLPGVTVTDLDTDGGFLYAMGGGSLHVLDLLNPIAPNLRSTLPQAGAYLDVQNNLVYVAGVPDFGFAQDSVFVVDVSDPDLPVQADALSSVWGTGPPLLANGQLYVATERRGLARLSDGSTLSLGGVSDFIGRGNTGEPSTVTAACNGELLVNAAGGLVRVSTGTPTAIQGFLPLPEAANWSECRDSVVWVSTSSSGLLVVNPLAGFPSPPVVTPSLGVARGTLLGDGNDVVYYEFETGQVHYLDTGDATQPTIAATLTLPPYAEVYGQSGRRIGFETGSDLYLADFADLANPVLWGPYSLSPTYFEISGAAFSTPDRVVVSASRLTYHNDLAVVDYTDPANPIVLGSTTVSFGGCIDVCEPPFVSQMLATPTHLYMTASGGVGVRSLADPNNMTLEDVILYEGHQPSGMSLEGSELFVSWWVEFAPFDPPPGPFIPFELGTGVYDVTVPSTPQLIEFLPTFERAGHPLVAEDYVYVRVGSSITGGSYGVHAIRRGTPPADHDVGTWFQASVTSLASAGNSIYASLRNSPYLQIVPEQCPLVTDVSPGRNSLAGGVRSVSPSPFNPRTVVEFEMTNPGVASVAAFDVRGRRVATVLAPETRSEGIHRTPWSARDERGQPMASGLYFVQLYIDGKQAGAAKKAVLLR